MLGSMLADYLSRDTELAVTATVRSEPLAEKGRRQLPEVEWAVFDAESADLAKQLGIIVGKGWLLNAIGITKSLVHDNNPAEVEQALCINSLLPFLLAKACAGSATRVLQIATDCVYSGQQGAYRETDAHDPLDVYGKTKSLGEVAFPNYHHLRCSIIGPEAKAGRSLLEWFLGQPRNASVNGFTNHHWNGVTTLHFAAICRGIIRQNPPLPQVQHIIPSGTVSKHELLKVFGKAYGRPDIVINPTATPTIVDRTLDTADATANAALWAAAGYEQPPGIGQMIDELAAYELRLTDMES